MAGSEGSGRIMDGYTFEREEAIRKALLRFINTRCGNCHHQFSLMETAREIGGTVSYDSLYRFAVGKQVTMHPDKLQRIEEWLKLQKGFVPVKK